MSAIGIVRQWRIYYTTNVWKHNRCWRR